MKSLLYYLKNVMDMGGLKRMLITLLVLMLVALGWYVHDGSKECLWAVAVVAGIWCLVVMGAWMNWRRDQ